ncbi:MAG: hypothetical protein AB7I38_11730 [Dehalococcoidia bacterium]
MIAIVTWVVTRYGVTDVIAAARGTEPPRLRERRERHQQAMERRAQRSGPTVGEALAQRIADRIAGGGGVNPPGPARQAMSDWWADCWADATDRRRGHRARRAAGDLPRQRMARAARRAWTGQGGPHVPHRPSTTAPRSGEVVDGEVIDAAPTSQGTTATDDPPATTGPDTPAPAPSPGGSTDEPKERPTRDMPADPPIATVHPIRRDVPTMTSTDTLNAETLDPQAGLAFAEATAKLLHDLAAQVELSSTTLTSRGVSGPVCDLFARLHDELGIAATTAEEAKTHFEEQIATQDVVHATDGLSGTVEDTYLAAR